MQTISYESSQNMFQPDNLTTLSQHLVKISEPTEINLQDFLARTDKSKISEVLKVIFNSLENDFNLKVEMPHPRHDYFLANLDYVTALLPEALITVTKKLSRSFTEEVTFVLDPEWQKAIDQKEIAYEDIAQIARQANNVIQSYTICWKVKKKGWQELDNTQSENLPLTSDMMKQLNEQLELAKKRNDAKAVESIQNFLKKNK